MAAPLNLTFEDDSDLANWGVFVGVSAWTTKAWSSNTGVAGSGCMYFTDAGWGLMMERKNIDVPLNNNYSLTVTVKVDAWTSSNNLNLKVIGLSDVEPSIDISDKTTFSVVTLNGVADKATSGHIQISGDGDTSKPKIWLDNLIFNDNIEEVLPYTVKWERKTPGSDPVWFSTGSNTRSIGYGEVGANKRLYAAYDGNKIKILNAATGADVGDLTMTGVSGGARALNTVRVTSDGKIFGTNLTTDASTSEYKIYMWSSEASAPTSALTYSASANRLGDNFEIKGSYTAGTAVIYAATGTNTNVLKWTQSGANAAFNPIPTVIALPNMPVTWGTPAYVSALGGGSSKFWASGRSSEYVREFVPDGSSTTGYASIAGIASADYFADGSDEYLALALPATFNGQVQKVAAAGGIWADRTGTTLAQFPPLGTSSASGLGDITTQANADGSFTVFVLSTNNGIGAYEVLSSQGATPITLLSFTAEALAGAVKLNWSTASETNNANFVIYRNDEPIAMIEGAGTSSETHTYSYLDNTVIPGVSYTYVLADVDYDQEETRYNSQAITVKIDSDLPEMNFVIGSAYPNPFNPQTVIPLELKKDAMVKVSLFDVKGRLVKNILNSQLSSGNHDIRLTSENLSSGSYLVQIIIDDAVHVSKITYKK